MATQHPDHAGKPFWHTQSFISTQHEAKEAYISFAELGIIEYKWDWEGKLVDESVLERFFSEYNSFFHKNPLGQERFLTFRLPNPKVETEFRLGRAFMNLASAASVAKHFGFPTPPLFEVILPMTETPEEILDIQAAYQEMHGLKHPLYRLEQILTNLRVIPLFEQAQVIVNSDKILQEYLILLEKRSMRKPPYLRPYIARSDPALNSGLVPTVLAVKIALSRYKTLEDNQEILLYPIIGAAALPFRGGISPLTVKKFADEYKGIRTTTIQSAFRYDFEKSDVIRSIAKLEEILPIHKSVSIPKRDEEQLLKLMEIFEKKYKEVIEGIAPLINKIALYLPARRERVQHTGLFGYSRGVGKIRLPRAIAFTGALYSVGVPPELIGTGRGLSQAKKLGKLDLILKYYKYLKTDLEQAGKYLNKDNLAILAKKSKYWKTIQEDVTAIEKILGISLGPVTEEEKAHKYFTDRIYKLYCINEIMTDVISEAALIRKSLG